MCFSIRSGVYPFQITVSNDGAPRDHSHYFNITANNNVNQQKFFSSLANFFKDGKLLHYNVHPTNLMWKVVEAFRRHKKKKLI